MKYLLPSQFCRSLNFFETPFLHLKNRNHLYLLCLPGLEFSRLRHLRTTSIWTIAVYPHYLIKPAILWGRYYFCTLFFQMSKPWLEGWGHWSKVIGNKLLSWASNPGVSDTKALDFSTGPFWCVVQAWREGRRTSIVAHFTPGLAAVFPSNTNLWGVDAL